MLKLSQSLIVIVGFAISLQILCSFREIRAEEHVYRWGELEANPARDANKTYELIKELQEYYRNSTDRDGKISRQRLDQLMWVAELEPEKCNEESWNKFLDILDLYAYDTINIRPYLLHHKNLIGKYCEGKSKGKNRFNEDSRSWQQMFDLVFKSEGNPLGNNETLNLLKKLVDMQKDDTSSANVEMREKLTKLVKLSELSNDKCTKENGEELMDLVDKYEYDTLNVQPYILYWVDKRKEFCKENSKQESRTTPTVIISDRQELRDLYDKLFSVRSKEEFGNETGQVLKQLYLSYKTRSDRSSRRRASKLERLVKLQELDSEERCNKSSYEELVELYDQYEFHRVNIVPYLNAQKEELARFCGTKKLERNLFEQDPNEWKNLHKKVYASDESESAPVGHAKTLEMLQSLHEVYSKRTDQRSRQRKAKVEKLIEVSELSRSKCNRRYRAEVEDLIEYNKLFTVNLLPYLKDAQMQQSKICRS